MKKKYILSLALAVCMGFTSCDMDQEPSTAISLDSYFVSATQFNDAQKGLYSALRSMTTGSAVLAPEFQTELFLPTAYFSNAYGDMSSWNITESTGTVEGIWGSYYTLISRANLIIDSFQKVEAGEKGFFSDQDKAFCNTIVGEAYFARAYSYFHLVQFFCEVYDASKADQLLGLPLQLKYEPSHYSDRYPSRASLADTYNQIFEDLNQAAGRINPKANDPYRVTLPTIKALEARIALYMKDYNRAIEASTALINSQQFKLAATPEDLAVMWAYDEGTEFIWRLYQNFPDELGGALGHPFHGQRMDKYDKQTMDFAPSTALLDLYQANDYRTVIYFRDYSLGVYFGAPQLSVKTFNKYPGNLAFQQANGLGSDNWYTNISKPFGIAEQYLIAAEAYTERNTGDDLAKGAALLNALRASRHQNYKPEAYANQEEQRQQVREERVRELVGEGFHLFDLKRWGLGFNRTNTSQINGFEMNLPYFNALKIEAGDHRFTWPIPKAEIDANPQIQGQQNPGY